MSLSLMTLGDQVLDPVTNKRESAVERHRAIVEASVAADEGGFEAVHIGEHHGLDYIYSAPPVILAAIGERTKNIKLSTAVTLVANLDPVRAAEDYATLDALNNGRVEVVVGRGNFFTSTYTMFGQNPDHSHELFEENIELLLDLWTGKPVTWQGKHRAPLDAFTLKPAPERVPSLWIGGGASESTAELAARLGLDLMLPSAFGNPAMFKPVVDNYLERYSAYAHTRRPQIGACWHFNVATTSESARERWLPRYKAYFDLMMAIINRVNPDPPAFIKKPFDFEFLSTKGPAIVGSPAEVVDRLGAMSEMLRVDVNLLSIDMGGQPADEFHTMVELIGSDVIPQLS